MKNLLFALSLAVAALTAEAANSFLYWTVDFNDAWENPGGMEKMTARPKGSGPYSVWLVADTGKAKTYLAASDAITIASPFDDIGGAVVTDISSLNLTDDLRIYAQIGTISGDDYEPVWTSYANDVAYLQLFIQADELSLVGDVWNAAVIPEPTGGLLVLLGLAGLALRRRRA